MWKEVKKTILEHKGEKWTDIYHKLKKDFTLDREYVESLLVHDNENVVNAAKWHLWVLDNYNVRVDYGNVVSIKLIIPSFCQAKCEFCFMNGYKNMEHDYDLFLNRFIDSLGDVVDRVYGKQPISLDISGNEPTFNPDLLRKVLRRLKNSKWLDKINRVTLTTNGYKLNEVLDSLIGVVNYVNISIHHYNLNERREIFNTWRIPTDEELTSLIVRLLDRNITTSAVSVVYKEIENFPNFVENFISWAKKIGFESVRFRGDCATDKFAPTFNGYIEEVKATEKYKIIQEENTNDSHWLRLVDKDGFFFFMLQGVASTYEYSRGIEYIINDDGNAYLDYYKEKKVVDNKLPDGIIFDKK